MPTEAVELKNFVARWLVKADADDTLNQDMVGVLANHHRSGTSTDDNVLKSLLTLTATPEASSDIH